MQRPPAQSAAQFCPRWFLPSPGPDTYVSVGGCALDAADALSLAGHGGGGVGQESIAEGVPAGAGVVQGRDDQGGFLVVLRGFVAMLGAAPDDAPVAQDAESDGVAAALGQEVAAE